MRVLGKLGPPPRGGPAGGVFGDRVMLSRSSALGSLGAGVGRSRGEPREIVPAEIKIMQRSDGGPWVLGEGASGLCESRLLPAAIADCLSSARNTHLSISNGSCS